MLAVTLRPAAGASRAPFWCLACSELALSEGILNALLFLPAGAVLAMVLRTRWVLLVAAAGSTLIELTQTALPGRQPSLADILANTAGALAGAWLVRTRGRWLADPRIAHLPGALAAAAVTLAVALTAVLVTPDFPRSVFYGQWAPQLGHLAAYPARVDSVRLGRRFLPSAQFPDAGSVSGLIRGGTTLRVYARAAAPPAGVASLFSIADRSGRTVLLIGPDGDDLVLRVRVRAAMYRLAAPELRVPHALRGVRAGDRLDVAVRRSRRGWCVSASGVEHCGLAYSTGAGLALLTGAREARGPLAAAWLAVLFVPLGVWARGRAGLAAIAVGAGVLVAAPLASPEVVTGLSEVGAAALGLAVGRLTRAALARRTDRNRAAV